MKKGPYSDYRPFYLAFEAKQLTFFDSERISAAFVRIAMSPDGINLVVVRGSTTNDVVLIEGLGAR